MNKAFMREPEQGAEYCPRCRSLGQPVGTSTLDALVRPEARAQIGDSACFCPFPTCDVAYFDAFDRTVSAGQLVRPAYAKDPDAPVCACFGLTLDDIDADIREGGVRRVRDIVERAKSPEARCAVTSPAGRPCTADVQRLFIQRRGGL